MQPDLPVDAQTRERFARELDRSFSLIAPAGVGKTRSITDRILSIATGSEERALDWLPKLVVVTYTNKAADEMHERTRAALIAKRANLTVLSAFQRSFFGTIHSFCVRLLRTYGHFAGLSTSFEPIENDEEVWTEFLRQTNRLFPYISSETTAKILRAVDIEDLFHLARQMPPEFCTAACTPSEPPEVSINPILELEPKQSRSRAKYALSKEAARRWWNEWKSGAGYAPPPRCLSEAREFSGVWRQVFEPFHEWRRTAAIAAAWDIARAYKEFRRAQGVLTFEDQISLAWELLRHPEAGRRIRAEGLRVILDEAQDTDPLQFRILLEIARPPDTTGDWLADDSGLLAPPDPGRFCMVGDPQQSIYGERASLDVYKRVRQKLSAAPGGEELVLSVTFRCDVRIIETTNSLVEPMFARTPGQVAYTPLKPRPGAGPGMVLRWQIHRPENMEPGVGPATREVGRQLGQRLLQLRPETLGAARWADVAMLCPRNRWMDDLALGLREVGVNAQLHTVREIRGGRPAYAWATALVHVLANPDDEFEVVGVLREIYGFSDEELARWIAGPDRCWSLHSEPHGDDEVSRTLRMLSGLCREVSTLPLMDALECIFERTALVERLVALQRGDPLARGAAAAISPEVELEALFLEASRASGEGRSLADFAQQLRERMHDELAAAPVEEGAIQLMTIHKAKGLQWPIVVLPLLYREISEFHDFPSLLRVRPEDEPRAILTSEDLEPHREALAAKRNLEMQRLLYVALTRAQRTLILTDDRALFPQSAKLTFANLLGLRRSDEQSPAQQIFEALSECPLLDTTLPCHQTGAPAVEIVPPVKTEEYNIGVTRLMSCPRRILPYTLSETQARAEFMLVDAEADYSPAAEIARTYGLWWHETMESLPWGCAIDELRRLGNAALHACPIPERGRREIDQLLTSEFFQRLNKTSRVFHREMPILWKRSEEEIIEGVIDLAVLLPDGENWLIVDWKTNDVSPENAAALLRELYTPQLSAYAEALRAITGGNVQAGVYSTAAGLWIPIG
ncbi:MAG: UvrD-helicase domain-containing protein [Kiritimatiellae bacterium]|nr:UvrD-helicase domain-containing protein [Kiritimatiellia bacterium]MDW8458741.1 UvrD-helicase domain-containing protein [Verrucomicrobiota bacterium]